VLCSRLSSEVSLPFVITSAAVPESLMLPAPTLCASALTTSAAFSRRRAAELQLSGVGGRGGVYSYGLFCFISESAWLLGDFPKNSLTEEDGLRNAFRA
jgi:hypothetical protein